MSWLDILLVVVFFLHLANGFFRGLVKQLFDLIGFFLVIIISFWGSRRFSGLLATYINPEDIIPHHELIESLGLEVALEKAPQLIAGVLAFLVLFLVLSLLFRVLSGGFSWVNKVPVIGFINRIGGAILGALIGIAFVYIIIAGMSLIPLQLFMEALDQSEVVFIADHYLTPTAVRLQESLLDYFLSLNG
ncbi:MAG: CvpA family protein [Firmicutes bacterium]|nr:CvpA family protein [Bacillota bacterium]